MFKLIHCISVPITLRPDKHRAILLAFANYSNTLVYCQSFLCAVSVHLLADDIVLM